VRELIDAVRDEGLRVGIYFSLSDWHHPDYPAFTDADKPYAFGGSPPLPTDEQWTRYHTFLTAQLRELLSDYGRIDALWFDGGWERPPDWWQPAALEQMIRELQPDILVNDRLFGVGDFSTPEQHVPALAPAGRWETCMTINHSWGHVPSDKSHKSARELVHTICEIAGKGGNLLLNVSPTGTGALPPEQVDRLDDITSWMDRYGESIVGTEPGLEPWQFYGPSTRRGDRVYLHLLMRPYDRVQVRGVSIKRVERVQVLGREKPLEFKTRTGIIESLMDDPTGELTILVPESVLDPLATVLAVDFAPA
jgi:alpha-L-fucosidase